MIFITRICDILLSIYLYNEKRGYTYLEELLKAFEQRYPGENQILASIQKHARDERRHHLLFEAYFRKNGRLPFRVGSWYGYCDQMVSWIFGKTIDQLDPKEVVNDDEKFFQLCRLIMITEMRGMKQVNLILENPIIRRNNQLVEIFTEIKKDEPSHCYPYQAWLRKHGKHEPIFREKLADAMVHYSLMLVKIPLLFFNFFLPRQAWT
ncbi:MAG: ferritin-like domain-containing protein [Bdellovibrionota bacterium]